jgi:DNA repair exonuclease SbcCD nuclease subunit
MAFKILYATDLHLRASRPVSRLDKDFLETQLGKLRQLADMAKTVNITILGGDIFDRPDVPHSVLIRALGLLNEFKPYSVIGNHDIFGYQGKSIDSSAIGVLIEAGAIKKLDWLNPQPGIQIHGIHAYDQIKSQFTKANGDKIIVVAHKMITDTSIPNAGCIMIDDFAKATNADLILSGDIHKPHARQSNGKVFINPGSMSRMSINDRDRIPAAVIITVNDDLSFSYKRMPFIVSDSVFKMNAKEFARNYAEAVQSVKTDSNRIAQSISEYLKACNSSDNIINIINKYYSESEKRLLGRSKE